MKVVEVVKPRMMRMMALGVNFMCSFFSPLTFTTRSYGGKGRKMRAMPDDGDQRGAEDEYGGEGQALGRDKADGEGQQELRDGDGELGEDVRYSALFLEYLHAAGRDAHVEEAVGRAGDDAEYVGQHVAVREAHGREEDEVERAAHERGHAAAEAVGDGPGEGVADEAAEAQRGDDREDAGDVVGAVGEERRCPRARRAPACTGP